MKKFLIKVLLKFLKFPPEIELRSYRTIAEHEVPRRQAAEREVSRLKAEMLGQEARLNRVVKVIAANIGDVEPTDQKARKDYVAQATNFYDAILEEKLLQMIAQVREQEDTIFTEIPAGMTRNEYDYVLKGTSNAFKTLMDWGESMKAERTADISNENNNE